MSVIQNRVKQIKFGNLSPLLKGCITLISLLHNIFTSGLNLIFGVAGHTYLMVSHLAVFALMHELWDTLLACGHPQKSSTFLFYFFIELTHVRNIQNYYSISIFLCNSSEIILYISQLTEYKIVFFLPVS